MRRSQDISIRLLLAVAAPLTALPGCLPLRIQNPAFALGEVEPSRDLARMRADLRPLERPVVVLGGWRTPYVIAAAMKERFRLVTSGDDRDFLVVTHFVRSDIPSIAQSVIERVEARWPGEDPDQTIEVDVIAHSMGGLVARLAASPDHPTGKRLRVRRLFTLATPHRGARLAELIAPDGAARDMRRGSAFLARLDELLAEADYELVCYAHLNDRWVGARNTAPPGREPIWTGGTRMFSHYSVMTDRLIRADVARRLRGESPIAVGATSPPRD